MVAFHPSPRPSTPVTTDRAVRAASARAEAQHDATLVQRFNGGDEGAFAEIVTRYREKMLAIAFARLRNHADAEEIAQDTFIRAHRGLANFRGDSSLATWLHRVATNLALNRYWYFFRRRRDVTRSLDAVLNDDGPGTFAEMIASDAPGPVRETTNREFAELVTASMARLRPEQQKILVLRNSLDKSYAEIALALGIHEGTVKSRIARARENLRCRLAEACPEFPADAPLTEWFDALRPGPGWQASAA